MPGPWEKYQKQATTAPEERGPWDKYKPQEEAPLPAPAGAPKWQQQLKPFTLQNGSQTVQRPDGAVYIKEANDPRFKGQEGWKIYDPKTGLWAPAGPEDASASVLPRALGMDALRSWGRNMLAGVQRPIDAGGALVADAGHALGLMEDQTYLDTLRTYDDRERYRQAVKNTSGSGAGVTQFMGEMIPAAAMMALAPEAAPTAFAGPQAMAPTITPWAQRAAANALGAAGAGYVMTPGTAEDRVKAGAVAGVMAPVAQAGVDFVVAPAVRALRPRLKATPVEVPLDTAPRPQAPAVEGGAPAQDVALKPNLAGRVAVPKAEGPINPRYQEVQDLFDQHGVLARPGDITGNPSIRRTEDRLLRQTPEMQDIVLRQNRQLEAAGQRAAGTLRQEMKGMGFETLAEVQRAAASGGKRGAVAKRLLDAVETSGEDWKLVLKTSGNMKLFQGKLAADEAYGQLEKLAEGYGEVPLTNTIRALEEVRRELASSGLPDEATERLVGKLYSNLTRQPAAQAEGQVAEAVGGATAKALPAASPVDTTFSGLRRLRSTLGSKVSDYYTGKGLPGFGKEGVTVVERVQKAIEKDMEEFAQANGPELAQAWRNADRVYKQQVAPYRDPALARALAEESPESLARMLTSKGDVAAKRKLVKSLDPKGQAALRTGILSEAMDAGAVGERGADGIKISPAKVATYLEQHQDAIEAAFPGLKGAEVRGLMRLMRHADRAGNVGANPMTGQVLEETLLKSQPKVDRAIGWLEKQAMLKYYTTPEGKQALLRASELKDGSPEMSRLFERFIQGVERGAALAAKPRPEGTKDQTAQ